MKAARGYLIWGFLVASVIGAPSPLWAQPASAPEPVGDEPVVVDEPDKPWSLGIPLEKRSTAKALFMEGNRLMRVPLPARAAEKYSAALALWKHPVFYFNLAVAQIALSQEVEARENLELSLAHGEKPFSPEKYLEVQKQLRDVKRQLGQIRVSCRTPGAEVTLDGVTLFVGPGSYQGWAKAKIYALTAKKAGYLAEARRVMVTADKIQDIELKLITLAEATDTSRRWANWKPWAVIAAGGVLAAASGGLHALAVQTFSSFDDEFRTLDCAKGDPPLGCPKEDPQLDGLGTRLTRAHREQSIAVGGYIVSGALIATGAILLYMNRPRLAEQGVGVSIGNIAVFPAISEDGLGVQMSISH